MPKDPKKNVDRYKIRGGDINEFEYDQNQEALAEQKPSADANLIPGTPPEKKAAGRKAWPRKISFTTRGASPKKLAAKKAAKKKATTKKATTKKAGKKAAKKK